MVLPVGPKEDAVLSYSRREQAAARRVRGLWRMWASGDFAHWYNVDGNRSHKSVELELDVGGRVRPVIASDDPDAVAAIISEKATS